MEQNINKRKNELLSSIMKNPKMSKTLGSALKAPIGSTKRDQARSVLSVMNKLNKPDGQGGPAYGETFGPQEPIDNKPNNDYSNMTIFPAAPKFKEPRMKNVLGFPSPFPLPGRRDVQVSPNVGTEFFKTTSGGVKGVSNFLKTKAENIFNMTSEGVYNFLKPRGESVFKSNPEIQKTGFGDFNTRKLGGFDVPNLWGNVADKASEGPSNENAGIAPSTFYGPQPSTAYGPQPYTSQQPTNVPTQTTTPAYTQTPVNTYTGTPENTQIVTPTDVYTGTPTTPDVSKYTGIKESAQRAIKEGTGAAFFAQGIADEKFGGSLIQYQSDDDEKVKESLGLTRLEEELSNKAAMKTNFVSTFSQYIEGKDEYLKFINEMIEKTEMNSANEDLSDPNVAARYNNYMKYLYTLKGRQNERYGNYLNSAINDYNSDLERIQSNYDNVLARYEDTVSRKTAISTNEYNTLYNTMADLYQNLEEAPDKRRNSLLLDLEISANRIKNVEDLIGQSNLGNENYEKDKAWFIKQWSDPNSEKKGTLNMAEIEVGGIAGLFEQVDYGQKDFDSAIAAFKILMLNTINYSFDPVKTTLKLQKHINDLSLTPGGESLAKQLNYNFENKKNQLMNSYILENMDSIKKAANELATGGYIGGNRLDDKEGWKEDYSNLSDSLLEKIYKQIQEGSYDTDPKSFFKEWFSNNPEDIARSLAQDL